jgi:hypothetical protein
VIGDVRDKEMSWTYLDLHREGINPLLFCLVSVHLGRAYQRVAAMDLGLLKISIRI